MGWKDVFVHGVWVGCEPCKVPRRKAAANADDDKHRGNLRGGHQIQQAERVEAG